MTINGSEAGDTMKDLEKKAQALKRLVSKLPMDSQEFKEAAKQLQDVNTQLAQARTKLSPIKDGMKDLRGETGAFGKVLQGAMSVFGGLGAADIAQTLLSWAGSIINISNSLEGLKQKAESVFGDSIGIVEGFAEKNAHAIGLARNEYRDLATQVGDLLTPMGFAQEEAAKLSTTLLNQAGILSQWSKGKVDTQQATEILQKALLGERDALNTLGIDIKDSLIQDELKKKGLNNLTGESLRQAEALITLEQITKQSANANADFATNTDSNARKQAELKARFSEVTQNLAERFVPIMNKAVDIVVPLIGWFANLGEKVYNLYNRIGYFKFLGVILTGFGSAIGSIVSGLGDLIDGVISLMDGDFSKAFESLKKGTIGLATTGGKAAVAMYDAYKGNDPAKKIEGEAGNMAKAGSTLAGAYADGFDKEYDKLRKTGKMSPKEQAKATKEAFEARLKEIELAYSKQELLTETAYQKGELSESNYGKALLLAKKQMYEDQIAAYKKFHQDETKEAIAAQKSLLEIEGSLAPKKIAALQALPGAAPGSVSSNTALSGTNEAVGIAQARAEGAQKESILRDQFARVVDLEQQHELRLAEIRRNAADINLQRLRDLGLQETDAFKRALDEQLAAQTDFEKKKLDNAERSADMKGKLEAAAFQAAADLFSLAADLLLEDEKNRSKHGSAIKAFQAALVITNGISEVQGIWAANAKFGVLGTVLSAVQTGIAVGRTALAIAKIQKTKFAGGGYTGFGSGMVDETGHEPVGVVHANEWVASPWMVRHPVYGRHIANLDSIRRRGFADGGYPTTPTSLPTTQVAGAADAQAGYQMMYQAFRDYAGRVDAWARSIYVAYSEISKVGSDINAVKVNASI